MKKKVSIALALLICLFTTGCGMATAPVDSQAISESEAVESEPVESQTVETGTAEPVETEPSGANGDYVYVENEDGTIKITEYLGTDTALAIPDAIDGKTVTAIGECCFMYKSLTSVTIPDSVIVIEGQAFRGNEKLESVILGAKTQEIGGRAFYFCHSLTSIELPETLTTLGYGVFELSGLQSIDIPAGITTIPAFTFSGTDMEEIVIPGTVKVIERDATTCKRVIIEEGVEQIDSYAIRGYKEYVEVPDSVTTFGEMAFDKTIAGTAIVGKGSVAEAYMIESGYNYQLRE